MVTEVGDILYNFEVHMIWADSLTNLQSIGGAKKKMAVMEATRSVQMEQKE